MAIEALPPGLLMIAGGALAPLLPRAVRAPWAIGLPLVTLVLVALVPDGPAAGPTFLGHGLEPVEGSALSRLFAGVFALMAAVGALFALRQERTAELSAALIYAGGAVGVCLAGDLITLFVFWEVMAIASAVVVWCGGTEASYRAGLRYLAIHLLGGVLLMAGIAAHALTTGGIDVAALRVDHAAAWLMLAGVLINAGAPPLSAWLPDAYPEASWSGSVFLSAFTTKTAVYVLLAMFAGNGVLVWFGLAMVLYGILFALLENDMRRIIAYVIVSQTGIMVSGAGIGTALAVNGAASHAAASVFYTALLLMATGSVLYMTGRRRCTDLGGLARSMPLTATAAVIGGLTLAGFPYTAGFVTKPMIATAAGDGQMVGTWLLLELATAGTVVAAAIKLPWTVFFRGDAGIRPADPPWSMRAAMLAAAALCLAAGLWPQPLYALLPHPVAYVPDEAGHLIAHLQLLLASAVAFVLLLPLMRRTESITLDVDWLWRRLPREVVREFSVYGQQVWAAVFGNGLTAVRSVIRSAEALHGPQGLLARTWALSSAVIWVLVMLAGYLVLYYAV